MLVKRCKECPFYSNVPILGGILDLLNGSSPGMCSYDASDDSLIFLDLNLGVAARLDPAKAAVKARMMARLRSRMTIPDPQEIPEACPLRTKSVTISLGN